MNQLSFLAHDQEIAEQARPLAHRNDPVTSRIAAREVVESGVLGAQQRYALEALRLNQGLTSDELGKVAKMDRHAIARRLSDLLRLGLATQGQRRKSKLTGRSGVTWFLVRETDPPGTQ